MSNQKFLSTHEAAEKLGLSAGYLAYLRTETAKQNGHTSPPYYRVNLNDGSANPIRIKYDAKELEIWAAKRREQHPATPIIERVSG